MMKAISVLFKLSSLRRQLSRRFSASSSEILEVLNESHKIIVMAGAGLSTASGVPDFRSRDSGIYRKLEEYNLPFPEAIFDMNYFLENPKPFLDFAKTLYPGVGNIKPNAGHYFVRLLEMKGKLLRMYTQNIDGLERMAGLSEEVLVEAHGTFFTASCIGCAKKRDGNTVKNEIMSGKVPICDSCKCTVKPDITFFGESLPDRFTENLDSDTLEADFLVIIGTSLVVYPFANIANMVSEETPRLLINRDLVSTIGLRPKDHYLVGEIVEEVESLVSDLGWKEDLNRLMNESSQKMKS